LQHFEHLGLNISTVYGGRRRRHRRHKIHCENEECEEFCEVSPVIVIRKLHNLHSKKSLWHSTAAAANAATKQKEALAHLFEFIDGLSTKNY